MISEELVERFRVISIDRFGRVESAWNRVLLEGEGSVTEMLREIHTVKGDASILGEKSVQKLCGKLEDLLQLAERLRLRISDDFELVVTMSIQFVGMLLRAKERALAGLDLAGFIRQIDDVLHETRRLAEQPRVPVRLARPSVPAGQERLADEMRGRFAAVATSIYLEGLAAPDEETRTRLHRGWSALQRELARFETIDADEILARRAQAGRDLAHELGKQVALDVERTGARLALRVGEAIDAALLHVVRNAIDHGIEDAAVRIANGKPAQGSVRIRARIDEALLEITVEDDGPGIDVAAVREAAMACGIEVGDRDAELVFEPGVSTRTRITDVSGRGVGLDAVKAELARVGGHIRLEPVEVGTSIRITVPTVVRRFSVYQLAVPGSQVPLAVSARWTHASTGHAAVIDPLHALGLGRSAEAPALYLRWGYMEVALSATAEPRFAIAERICPTPDDHVCEVILIDGREALLLRPEHLDDGVANRS
jgi:two-component system chemotaxis sensor kinase CheA